MTHPSIHARTQPDKIAYQMAGTGKAITYRELDELSNQGAQLFRSLGLKAGDHIAFLMENRLAFMEICWAAQRSGLYYTAISRYLTQDEIAYIVKDCGAKVVITSPKCAEQIKGLVTGAPGEPLFFMLDEPQPGFRSWDNEAAAQPTTPIADQEAGYDMLYSSGTTGRPKGIKRASDHNPIELPNPFLKILCADMCGMNSDSIYLSPAPLYHAAPLRFNMMAITLGGTSIIMESFDAEEFLKLVEKYKVTQSQLVPTMFVRMLKLPEEVRKRYDVSSLKGAIHAAAPCPIDVKARMIEWWGPILIEYYAGSEGNGVTVSTSQQWLTHRGTVGRAVVGKIKILDENDQEVPAGQIGTVYFADAPSSPITTIPRRRSAPTTTGLVDARRCRLSRRGRLPLSHRPQELHDHLRRREHLSAGNRGRADHPSRCRRRRRVRRAQRGDGRRGQGGGAAARHENGGQGTGSRADSVLPQASVADQMPEEHRLRGRTAAHAYGKAGEAPSARQVLAEDGVGCIAATSSSRRTPGRFGQSSCACGLLAQFDIHRIISDGKSGTTGHRQPMRCVGRSTRRNVTSRAVKTRA